MSAALVLCVLAALGWWVISDDAPAPPTRADVDRAVQQGIEKAAQDQRNAPPDAATAYRRIAPSVVTITTGNAGGAAGGAGQESLGTGVVVNEQGAILTSLHVVDGGGAIQVRFADGTQATARVVTRQPANDIAVLAADRLPGVVVPAVLGGGVRVGDPVFPVGHPLGLVGSLSAGVVSATDRTIRPPGGSPLTGLIQFDAAVNPGNSGGPLLNRDGQVVGIVTALANPSEQPHFVGIGFAVPIGTASGAAGGPQQ